MPEEVPLGEDCRDWAQKLTDHERNLLTQIFRFFTQADVEVQDCYHEKYGRVFKPTEIKMMLAAFSNMETVHIAAYSHLLDTIGMPESEYGMFLQYKEMKDKHDYLSTFGVDTDEDIARTLAMFGGFTEGLQLFASFAMLMNFPRFNKMKGMGQIVAGACATRACIAKASQAVPRLPQGARLPDQGGQGGHPRRLPEDGAAGGCVHRPGVRAGPGDGMTPNEIKKYIRYIADWRLGQLGLQADLHGRRAPAAVARADAQRRRARQLLRNPRDRIFEGRDAGELGRGMGQFRPAPEGQGGERRTAEGGEGDGEDMFSRAGVAAE